MSSITLETILAESSTFFSSFKKTIRMLRNESNEFTQIYESSMATWKSTFNELYSRERLLEALYIRQAFLIMVSGMLVREVTGMNSPFMDILSNALPSTDILQCFQWLTSIEIDQELLRRVETIPAPEGDMFNRIYPTYLPQSTKHGSGEYYTPPTLAALMVQSFFEPGMTVVDPACGSGTFLLEAAKEIVTSELNPKEKIKALSKITGMDKNPLAIFMTTINLILFLHHHDIDPKSVHFNVFNIDSLFTFGNHKPVHNILESGFDIVIGNPPWIVLGGIENGPYKERIKSLSMDLGIYVGGKNASNLEVAILFFFKFLEFLKPSGWVFFILPNSIITGSQHAKARAFNGFSEIKVWKFTKQPFKIHSVCLAGKKSQVGENFDFHFPFTTIETKKCDVGEWTFKIGKSEIHEPVSIEQGGDARDQPLVGRIVSLSRKKKLLPMKESPYMPLFYKGAQVFPRKMLFVDISREQTLNNPELVEIYPSKKVNAKKLARWNFEPYVSSVVERQYIHKIAKSTFLVPFMMVEYLDAFLPFTWSSVGNFSFLEEVNDLPQHAQRHLDMLNGIYQKKMKQGGSHSSLKEIINFQNCLGNPRQGQDFKVVFNGGGSIVKGAIVRGNVIVDYSMFYYPAASPDEAYYLLGYLNAPSLTESVKLVGSTGFHGSLRNIVKHPLDFPWPLFQPEVKAHQDIVSLAKRMEQRVSEIVFEGKSKMDGSILDTNKTRISIQNSIFEDQEMKISLEELDDLVTQIVME